MNRHALSTIFAFTVFSLYSMEENSGGSAGNSQSIFDVDALLATERPSWRQVTREDLQEIAQRLGVPDKAVRDASIYYKNVGRDFDTFRNADRQSILSGAEMYRGHKAVNMNIGREKRMAWDAISAADKKRKAEEVGVSFQAAQEAFLYYRTNQRKPEVFWQASGQELKEAANLYKRNLQKRTQSRRDKQSAARRLLETETSGEQS